jgi:glutaminyl-peptide cyclotransferase
MILCAGGVVSCHSAPQVPVFDGDRAFELLQRQTDLGPRNPESVGWQKFQILAAAYFDSLQVPYQIQKFVYDDYLTGASIGLANWIVTVNPEAKERILICAHYDSRPRAEMDPDSAKRHLPILGANDGASGTAVVIYLADVLHKRLPRVGVDLVLFDGEDYGPQGKLDQYFLGSTYFATHHTAKYTYGILLDMIGDSDLHISRELLSDRYAKFVNDKIWQAAARRHVSAFVDKIGDEVLDDHLPLTSGGIPTIDIIDFQYPYWHTQGDTPDKCSASSLAAVGQVLLDVIYAE